MNNAITTKTRVWGSVTNELDSETLEVLYNKCVVACAKAKLLGQHNETAYHTDRSRKAANRELEHRRKKQKAGERETLGPPQD